MSLKGTKTQDNLKAAFAGESQANRRYLYFAQPVNPREITTGWKPIPRLQRECFRSLPANRVVLRPRGWARGVELFEMVGRKFHAGRRDGVFDLVEPFDSDDWRRDRGLRECPGEREL